MKLERARPLEPFAATYREFPVEVYGPLFGAIGPAEAAVERRSPPDEDYGKSLWQALSKMSLDAKSDLRVPKQRHYVQGHTHRFTVSAYLDLAHGAAL